MGNELPCSPSQKTTNAVSKPFKNGANKLKIGATQNEPFPKDHSKRAKDLIIRNTLMVEWWEAPWFHKHAQRSIINPRGNKMFQIKYANSIYIGKHQP